MAAISSRRQELTEIVVDVCFEGAYAGAVLCVDVLSEMMLAWESHQ
jgi:hypothetical protein